MCAYLNSTAGKSAVECVSMIENQVATFPDGNWHVGLKNKTKIVLALINEEFAAEKLGSNESEDLKQRVYIAQDKLIEAALW